MHRFLSLLAALIVVGSLRADSPPSVADLVKQLGDERFAKRELAQRELMKRGEAIVPELDRLAKSADAETAERLRKIRYDLVGFKDDIRRLLADVPQYDLYGTSFRLSPELRGLIDAHQPTATELLLGIIAERDLIKATRASRVIVATWDLASAAQIDTYIRRTLSLQIAHPPRFPAGVGMLICVVPHLQFGWDGWPPPAGDKIFPFHVTTTCLLDGKAVSEPVDHAFPITPRVWHRIGKVSSGKHTVSAVLDYEFTHRSETRKGRVISENSTAEAMPEDNAGNLRGQTSVDLGNYVRGAFRAFDCPRVKDSDVGNKSRDPDSYVRWEASPGKWVEFNCPQWSVTAPLSVDLCFEVEIRVVETGRVYAAEPVIVRKGQKSGGYLHPIDFRGFARDLKGSLDVRLKFTPSRLVALFDPGLRHYYPDEIGTEKVTITIRREAK